MLCYGRITDVGLCEAAKRLPLLEELEISYCNVTAKALQKFGECCPQLRSLKRNQPSVGNPHMDDSDAMAIAKYIPKVCHLQLFGNHLTNRGLKAILDGCPELQSLDLRQCLNVDPKSPSAILCAERVKDFRGPFDSTDGYEFDTAVYGSLRLFKSLARPAPDVDW